ncbi:hypothetical protein KBD59_03100 [Candidatus Gracilibacteria bacterium]|nr:hypothetical protein [Candidatus Gracilibacteria bacterium]
MEEKPLQHPYEPYEPEHFLTAGRIAAVIVVSALFLGLIVWGTTKLYKKGPQEQAQVPPVPVSATPIISAAEGGVVISDVGGARIIVPPGALEKDLILEMKRIQAGTVIDEFQMLPIGTKFIKPVLVLLPYNEEGLGLFEKSFRPRVKYEWDGEVTAPYAIDRQNKLILISLKSF